MSGRPSFNDMLSVDRSHGGRPRSKSRSGRSPERERSRRRHSSRERDISRDRSLRRHEHRRSHSRVGGYDSRDEEDERGYDSARRHRREHSHSASAGGSAYLGIKRDDDYASDVSRSGKVKDEEYYRRKEEKRRRKKEEESEDDKKDKKDKKKDKDKEKDKDKKDKDKDKEKDKKDSSVWQYQTPNSPKKEKNEKGFNFGISAGKTGKDEDGKGYYGKIEFGFPGKKPKADSPQKPSPVYDYALGTEPPPIHYQEPGISSSGAQGQGQSQNYRPPSVADYEQSPPPKRPQYQSTVGGSAHASVQGGVSAGHSHGQHDVKADGKPPGQKPPAQAQGQQGPPTSYQSSPAPSISTQQSYNTAASTVSSNTSQSTYSPQPVQQYGSFYAQLASGGPVSGSGHGSPALSAQGTPKPSAQQQPPQQAPQQPPQQPPQQAPQQQAPSYFGASMQGAAAGAVSAGSTPVHHNPQPVPQVYAGYASPAPPATAPAAQPQQPGSTTQQYGAYGVASVSAGGQIAVGAASAPYPTEPDPPYAQGPYANAPPASYQTSSAGYTAGYAAPTPPYVGAYPPVPPPAPEAAPAPGPTYGHSHSASLGGGSTLGIPGMATLSISGGAGGTISMAPSPLLAPYTGTYQTISPMPSPMLLSASGGPLEAVPDFSLGGSSEPPAVQYITEANPYGANVHTAEFSGGFSIGGSLKVEPVEPHYDPTEDAKAMLKALKGYKPDIDTIISILPRLSGKQILELRSEYKRIYKQVNIAKHLKATLSGAFGRIAWVTALGPYESEGWWANTWYQKSVTRNELLIESMMGKTIAEVRRIKMGFKDPKYSNDLVRALRNELPANKFQKCILLSLDEDARMPDDQTVDTDRVQRDVEYLYDTMGDTDRRGHGETRIIEIIVKANEAHLREVVRWYMARYKKDLSKVLIRHSANLVGEALCHVLAGVIDKATRDAKLIENALEGFFVKEDLLISRLVRIHWDVKHLAEVKEAYKKRYKKDLRGVLAKELKGDFGEFVCELMAC